MSRPNPEHRYRAVRAAAVAPEHPLERAAWDLFGHGGTNVSVARAAEIFLDAQQKEVLQAWIVAGATDQFIKETTRLPEEVTAAFRHLFFDVQVFRDELELLAWVNTYEQHGGTKFGTELLKSSIMHGVDYLRWMYGRGEMNIDPATVLKRVMTDSYFRGRMNRGHALSSKEMAAAHTLMNTAAKIATQLGKTGAPNVNDIVIKLKFREMTENVEQVAAKEDILH